MSNLKIIRNGEELDFKLFVFSGGEVSVKLNLNTTAFVAKTKFFAPYPYQTIIARIKNSNDILELANLTDALRRVDDTPIRLFMPYVPYARQDRVCDLGESFSLKVFANIINSLNFQKVIVCDPHSDVCDAVFNNLIIITQFDIINKWTDFIKRVGSGSKFVSPDAGSNKKTAKLANFFGHGDFIRGDKIRDLTNGNIKETIVYCDDLNKKDIVCSDDICDGGRTFTELAKKLKEKNCGKVILFVTHGIFSKGVDCLYNDGIDEIWTTDSFCHYTHGIDERVRLLKLEEVIEL